MCLYYVDRDELTYLIKASKTLRNSDHMGRISVRQFAFSYINICYHVSLKKHPGVWICHIRSHASLNCCFMTAVAVFMACCWNASSLVFLSCLDLTYLSQTLTVIAPTNSTHFGLVQKYYSWPEVLFCNTQGWHSWVIRPAVSIRGNCFNIVSGVY